MTSQCDGLLALLEDGEWWTTADLLREVPCIVHSRISELRDRRDLIIEHERTGPGAAGSRYRLASVAPGLIATSTQREASGEGNEPGTGATQIGAEPETGVDAGQSDHPQARKGLTAHTKPASLVVANTASVPTPTAVDTLAAVGAQLALEVAA